MAHYKIVRTQRHTYNDNDRQYLIASTRYLPMSNDKDSCRQGRQLSNNDNTIPAGYVRIRRTGHCKELGTTLDNFILRLIVRENVFLQLNDILERGKAKSGLSKCPCQVKIVLFPTLKPYRLATRTVFYTCKLFL